MIYRSKHFMLTAGQPIGIELEPDERPFLPLQRLFGGYQGHKHLLWQSPLLSDNTRRLCIAFHFAQALLYLYDAGWIAQGWQFPDLEIVNHPETGLQPLLTIVAHQTSFHAGNRNRLVLDPAGAGPTATQSSLGSLRPAAEESPPDHWQRLHDDLQTLGFFILSAWYGELVTEKEAAFDTILDPYGDQNALALDDKSTHWEERLRADGHGKLAVVVKYLFATLTAPRVRSRLTDRGVAGAYVQGVLGPLGELIWTR